MDAYQAIQALSLRGVGIGHGGGDTLTVNAPADLMTEDLRGWFREAKRPFLTYFKTGVRVAVKTPPPLPAIRPATFTPVVPVPEDEDKAEPVASPLPDEWTDPSVSPGLLDAFRRSIKAEDVAEILAFHREMNAANRKPSPTHTHAMEAEHAPAR